MTLTAAPRPFSLPVTWLRLSLGFIVMAVMALPCLVASVVVLPWRMARIRVGNLYGKVVGWVIARMAGAHPVFEHRERVGDGPAIYVSNHASALDIFVGMWVCPMGGCGVAKKEISRIPFLGWLYWLSGHLLIDRSDRDQAIAALQETAQVVKRHGMSIWIWPEGTRSANGQLQKFKKGFAHLAIATRLPIRPVVLHNAHRIWPNKSRRLVPGELRIQVLEAIDTSGWKLETLNQHIQQVQDRIKAALGPEQAPEETDG